MELRVNNMGIVDRIEGEYYVIEVNGETVNVYKDRVSVDVKEGDTVVFKEGTWYKDEKVSEDRSKKISKLMDDVWAD